LVPDVLPLAVPRNGGRVLVAITAPVIKVSSAPLLNTVPAYLAVFGVGGYSLAVIIGATSPLAARFAANRLPWLVFRWLEDSFTVAATPFDHIGGCRTVRPETKNLETVVELDRIPADGPFQLQNRRKCSRFKLALTSRASWLMSAPQRSHANKHEVGRLRCPPV
jgi:hypothetical protein